MRLTSRIGKGTVVWNNKGYCDEMGDLCKKFKCEDCPVYILLNRLAEYEDTGFEPKEIEKLEKIALYNADKLIDKIEQI